MKPENSSLPLLVQKPGAVQFAAKTVDQRIGRQPRITPIAEIDEMASSR